MQKPRKIVIVSQHYAPDPSTTASYMTAIAAGLTSIAEVLVISGTRNSSSWSFGIQQPTVVEIISRTPPKNALAKRALAMLVFSIRTFFATLLRTRKHDLVFCVTTPFTLPYAVTLAAKLRSAATVLLIYDLYPEALEMTGLVKRDSLLSKIVRVANGLLLRSLDSIITIGRDVEPLLLRYHGVSSKKIEFIPNWALLPLGYRPVTFENPFRASHGNKLVIGLSGNLGFTHSATTVFEAAQLLQDNPNIQFMLSGWGPGWQQLNKLQTVNKLGNVTLVDPVPEAALEDFLAAADVWVIPYRRNVAGVSVPSRLYNLLAIGRSVIVAAESTSEAAMIVREEDLGWVVPPEAPQELAAAIQSAAADRVATTQKGERSAIAARRYTHDYAVERYRQVVSNTISRHIGHEI